MESMKQLLSGSLPDYFSLNEEQIMLYEGLIMSSTISTAIAHYSNQLKSSDYNVFINKIKASNGQENTFGIRIDFKNNLDRDIVIKKILFSFEQCSNITGWFPSTIIKGTDGKPFDKIASKDYMESFNSVNFVIEAKFDVKVDIDTLPRHLYHLTFKLKLPKITKNGLTPKYVEKLSYHPERIYLSTDLDAVLNFKKLFKKWNTNDDKYSILEIDKNLLPQYVLFFQDPNFVPYGIYTMNNIPPYAIKEI